MKIVMIRHARVDAARPKRCTAAEYEAYWTAYDDRPIVWSGEEEPQQLVGRLYTSTLARTKDTAERLFPGCAYETLELLDEVPLKAFRGNRKRTAMWFMDALARIEWFFGSARQPELRGDTLARAQALFDTLEARGGDCTLITHGFYMKVLVGELKRRGYSVRNNTVAHKNLTRVEAEKK